jgi:hypothetical protein
MPKLKELVTEIQHCLDTQNGASSPHRRMKRKDTAMLARISSVVPSGFMFLTLVGVPQATAQTNAEIV